MSNARELADVVSTSPSTDINVDNGTLVVDISENKVGIGTTAPEARLHTITNSDDNLMIARYQESISGAAIFFRKSYSNTLGSDVLVPGSGSGYEAGKTVFQIYDGASYSNIGSIVALTDGPTGSGDTPGKLVFKTTADGTNTETEKMVIKSDGKVGIGTTAPSELLSLAGLTTASDSHIYIGCEGVDSGNYQVGLKLRAHDNNHGFTIEYDNTSPFGLNILRHSNSSGGTSAIYVARESGKVGINNTVPQGKLTISEDDGTNAPTSVTAPNTYLQLGSGDYGTSSNGKFMIGFGYTNGNGNTNSPAYIGFEEVSTTQQTKGDLTFYTRDVTTDTAPTERMRIKSDGNAEISGGDLLLKRGSAISSLTRTITIGGTRNGSSSKYAELVFQNYDSDGAETDYAGASISAYIDNNDATDGGELTFSTSTGTSGVTERMRIDSAGKVGIGTTAPVTALSVQKAEDTVYANVAPNSTDAILTLGNIQASETTSDQAQIQFNVYGGSQNRVGSIGMIAESDSNRKSSLVFTTDDGTSSGRPERMRITGDGLVGIGTTAPSKLLHLHESTASTIKFTNSTTGTGATDGVDIDVTGTTFLIKNHENGQFVFEGTSGTDLFRITTSAIDGEHLNARVTVTSGDADTIYVPGLYRLDPSVSNKPSSSHHYAMVVFGNGSNVTTQIAVRVATVTSYVRSYNTSWTNWSQFN